MFPQLDKSKQMRGPKREAYDVLGQAASAPQPRARPLPRRAWDSGPLVGRVRSSPGLPTSALPSVHRVSRSLCCSRYSRQGPASPAACCLSSYTRMSSICFSRQGISVFLAGVFSSNSNSRNEGEEGHFGEMRSAQGPH